jgi:hypothetical protein
LTHTPAYGIDIWDVSYVQNPTTQMDMRSLLVNRTYIVDKLYPPNTLTSQNLAGYDILIVCDPVTNFTASEVAAVTAWVNAGGSILGIADHTVSNNQNMNYLLSNMDIGLNNSVAGTNALVPSGNHPVHEGCSSMSCLAPGSIAITGSAFSLWEDASGVPVIGGDQYGNGRVILMADGAIVRDCRIGVTDNAQSLINFANWLSAATAKVLLYNDEFHSPYLYQTAPVQALESLGIDFYVTHDEVYLNISLYKHWSQWDLVIFDEPGSISNEYLDDLQAWVETGGKMICSFYWIASYASHPIWPLLGFIPKASAPDSPDIHIWATGNPIFNLPVDYSGSLFHPTDDYGSEGATLHVFANATSLAGLTASPEDNQSIIAIRNDEQVLFNSFLIDEFQGDFDNSTYVDSFELWLNEIGYIDFDRPTIDSPADVTYMETETGNEITWIPTADAGPWEYVLRVNGSIDSTVHWSAGPITINVDGINASITEYELTVYDRLGYSASDLVVLNVTEYVAPPPPGGIDPLILIAVGAGIAAVVVIIIIVLQKNKKK